MYWIPELTVSKAFLPESQPHVHVLMLCSHGTAITGLALEPTTQALRKVIRSDENAICVDFAMDALGCLAHLRPEGETASDLQAEVSALLAESPMRCWESLVRSGLRL